MTAGENTTRKILPYVAAWFIIWALLFEFLLPVNRFLPAPSVLLRSFGDLWRDYNFGANLLSSVSVIYVSLAVSFFLLKYLRNVFLSGKGILFNILLSLEWFAEFVPGIIIGMLLIFWFPQSDYTELIFIFLLVFTSSSISLFKLRKSVNKDYRDAGRSLGLKGRQLSLVEYNSVLPKLIASMMKLHFYAWTMLIIFEFINAAFGIGNVLRQALEYRDLSAFTASMVIIGITIYLGTLLLRYLESKFFSWD